MESTNALMKILTFFQSQQAKLPGDWDYDAAFCQMLASVTSAEQTSIWQLDNEECLHLVYGSNVEPEEVKAVAYGIPMKNGLKFLF